VGPRAGLDGGGARNFLQNVKASTGTHAASYSMNTGVIPPGVKLTTLPHLAQQLRSSGAIPLLPLYAFIAWIRTTLPFQEVVH
jgi:hypothetical protein